MEDVRDEQDSVEREIVVAAPVERVWELITKPEHVRVWYAFDGTSIDLRPGGTIEHIWREHGRFLGVVEDVVPPTLFTYWYSNVPDTEPAPGTRTHVSFRLEPTADGHGTVLRVRESGLGELTLSQEERRAYLAATTQGWSGGLTNLREHAERVAR
ncbi:SRPBCC domain-containing protein [Nonomuraea jiangxiensis]|uniref:Uncharacterized conserved protein YndB, AHSA1/START domain n=1 Tax=Nonomuraea jiangxiensis TaxID=633440 RepID=A0A1G8UTB2_9ACTN|nr:SRPBCC domain-containing protein [Nonomuraea jiangxiensis]SDJ56325.1 Uncharacterized conserved protein YndB, AHSA1/START domain [Nonomuraea jiangxiensis]